MSDTNEAGSFAATGSGKSEAEVAFELLNKLKGQGVWGERNLTAILDMYAECLDAAKGLRAYPGQSRIEAPVKAGGAKPAAPAQQAATPQPAAVPQGQAAQAAPVQAQPAPAQPAPAQPAQVQATPVQQPVHVQQQAVQQAFKQG